MKFCRSCGKDKQKYEFYKNKTRYDGLASQCKECQLKYSKRWYGKNAERKHDWYEEYLSNPEKREKYRELWRKSWYRKQTHA